MFNQPIYLGIVAGLLLGVALALVAYRFRREAKRKRDDVKWFIDLLGQALEDINTEDVDKILAGLQILTYINDPTARLKALPRLAELAQHPNPLVARQARVTMEKLSNFAKR